MHLLDTNIPEGVLKSLRSDEPSWPVLRLMDVLVSRALIPDHPDYPRRSPGKMAALCAIPLAAHAARAAAQAFTAQAIHALEKSPFNGNGAGRRGM